MLGAEREPVNRAGVLHRGQGFPRRLDSGSSRWGHWDAARRPTEVEARPACPSAAAEGTQVEKRQTGQGRGRGRARHDATNEPYQNWWGSQGKPGSLAAAAIQFDARSPSPQPSPREREDGGPVFCKGNRLVMDYHCYKYAEERVNTPLLKDSHDLIESFRPRERENGGPVC